MGPVSLDCMSCLKVDPLIRSSPEAKKEEPPLLRQGWAGSEMGEKTANCEISNTESGGPFQQRHFRTELIRHEAARSGPFGLFFISSPTATDYGVRRQLATKAQPIDDIKAGHFTTFFFPTPLQLDMFRGNPLVRIRG